MDSVRLGLGVVIAAVLLALPSAASADVTTNCANLQAALDNAMNSVITLNETCTNTPFTLPSRTITLQAESPGDGFNGTSGNLPILKGSNVGNTTIEGLTFTGGNATQSGGAIQIIGATATPQILNNTFEDNVTSGFGGGVFVITGGSGTTRVTGNVFGSVGHGNAATNGSGGGLSLQLTNDAAVISGNTFVGNSSTADNSGGGGAHVSVSGGSAALTVSDNNFDGNSATDTGTSQADGGNLLIIPNGTDSIVLSGNTFAEGNVDATTTGRRHGGGVGIFNSSSDQATVTQIGNTFDENTIGTTGSGESGGGGEWVIATKVNSTGDKFTSNHILDSDGEGGGIGVEGYAIGPSTFVTGEFHASNLVVDGNSIGSGGRGGGIYAGSIDECSSPDCPSVLELNDSTVAANCVASGGTGTEPGTNAPGIAGSGLDMLTLRNSIVYNAQAAVSCGTPPAETDVAGFTAPNTSVTSSDLCFGVAGTGGPVTGAGNICADPLLLNPQFGDFHETASSPTINAGSNALVPPTLLTDLDGEARIAQGTVDMGADEVQPPPPTGGGGPPAVDTTKPVFKFLQRVLTVDRNGRVKIRLRCVEQSRCIGTLSLVTQKALVAKRKARKLKVGSKRFNIAGGKTGVLTIKLSSRARKLLTRSRSLKVVATVTGADTAGNKGSAVKRTLTLKRAKPKHRKSR